MKRILAGALLLAALSAAPAWSQSASDGDPVKGAHEFGFWGGAAYPFFGLTTRDTVYNAGFRYGWVLTDSHGPSFLRGRFEYTVDAEPFNLIYQLSGATYGIGLSVVGLRWDFDPSTRIKPYVEADSGPLYTFADLPIPGTSKLNFSSAASVGVSVPRGQNRWDFELRVGHISNGGITRLNPGVQTIGIRVGFYRYSGGR